MKIPTEDFTDKTLAIDDTRGDDVRGGDWGSGHGGWQGGMWSHLVAKFSTIACGTTWRPNFQLKQVVPPSDQISN